MKKALFILLLLVLVFSMPARGESDEGGVRAVLERVSPSLVKVVAENGRKYVASGVALGNGLVVTSAQVVRMPFAKLAVETTRGETIAAMVAGQDERLGLTLLRLKKGDLPTLPPAAAADVGSWVALVGLFYETFPAVTQGIVSSSNENELILNAPVAPGSAGGAVVNKKGELLGVIRGSVGFSFSPDLTFKDQSASIVVKGSRSQGQSLCYAIPAGRVLLTAKKLKAAGKIAPAWMGVIFVESTNVVQGTYEGSPAAKAGITGNDRIVRLAGRDVADWKDIVSALASHFAGDKVDVLVERNGKNLGLQVVLGDRALMAPPEPPKPPAAPEIADIPELARRIAELSDLTELDPALPRQRHYVIEYAGSRVLGVDVMEITPDLGRKFSVQEGYGLLVSKVFQGSAAAKAGLGAGDVLVSADGKPLRNVADLRRALDSLKDKQAVLLALYRDGRRRKFSIVPDKGEKRTLDIRSYLQKMESMQDNLGYEAKILLEEEIRKLKQAEGREHAEERERKLLALRKAREQNLKLTRELERLRAEKEKLADPAQKEYSLKLKQVQEELRRLEEMIKAEEKKGE